MSTQRNTDGRPWRIGILSLIAIVLVVGGVLIFGGRADVPDSAAGQADITIPPLPTTTPPATGKAPDFALDLFNGERFSLSEHLAVDGRPVILNLWASWCPPCRDEMPDLEAAALANPDVVILGVAVDDDPLAAEAFAGEIEVTYPTGFDETGVVSNAYPTVGLPATFVISPAGEIVATAFGRLTVSDIEDLIDAALAS